jgi:hypothetical protein
MNKEEKENIKFFKLGNYDKLTIPLRRIRNLLGSKEYISINNEILKKLTKIKKMKHPSKRKKLSKIQIINRRKIHNKRYYLKNKEKILQQRKKTYFKKINQEIN